MSITYLSDFSIALSEMKFDMRDRPTSNENNQISVGIGSKIRGIEEIESLSYATDVAFFVFLGDEEGVEEKQKNWSDNNLEFLNETEHYFYANFTVNFSLEQGLEVDENGELIILDELSQAVMNSTEPYFKELLSSTFSRSAMATPPVPVQFWKNIYETE
ncbi:hypothetical protein [Lactococcus formosensis]|uniref:hypothetical protein n=1 Tax=Lactococcus formosensis TaxID=1281486 RepID=UPI002890C963|nr:hypothetical protein [Lactococcus formosensis]MDT2725670.1 hypothetical protein [Lactococcus formosensis]